MAAKPKAKAKTPVKALDLPKLTPHLAVLAKGLNLTARPRIVDVGANPMVAEAPYAALLQMDACDVVGFEPQPVAFAELEKIKSARETYLPFAVGDGTPKTLRLYRSNGFASVFDPYVAGGKYLGMQGWQTLHGKIDFDTVRLDDSADIGAFDVLKIDIQGGEYDVFRGAETCLKHCMVVIVELRHYRLYDDEPMSGGIDTELRRQGFYLHKFLSNKAKMLPSSQAGRLKKRANRDQLIDGDGVYLRDMALIETYTDQQLTALCMTAAAVFVSHSLVLHILDELVRRGVALDSLPADYVAALPTEFLSGDAT